MTKSDLFKPVLKLLDVVSMDSFRDYSSVIIPDPSFTEYGILNVRPQFTGSKIGALRFRTFSECYPTGPKLEIVDCQSDALESLRFERVVFWAFDLSVVTLWQQAEVAVVLLRKRDIAKFGAWIDETRLLLSRSDSSICQWSDAILLDADKIEDFMS